MKAATAFLSDVIGRPVTRVFEVAAGVTEDALVATLQGDRLDAVICRSADEWRDEPACVRLLRAVRDRMVDDGVLLLIGGAPTGSALAGHAPTVPALVRLVRASGFEVTGVQPDDATRAAGVRIVARPLPVAPEGLAHNVHQPKPGAATPALNLKWTPDEIELLEPTPEQIWSPLLSDFEQVATIAREYALTDTWGGERSAAVLSSFFAVDLSPAGITFGAGATGLLRHLAALVRGGTLLAMRLAHRDFPVWAAAEGARLEWLDDGCDADRVVAAIEAVDPDAVYLERPSPAGAIVPLATLAAICRQARARGAFVVVDEAYLAYFAGAGSAAALVPTAQNLIVIRSLSKAYCCGGLRVGIALAGATAAPMVRRLAAPLQVSELAFQLGLRLVQAGDIFRRLRHRIQESRREVTTTLTSHGFELARGDESLPWALVADPQGRVQADLAARGIEGKPLVPFSATERAARAWLRLSVPLSDERRALFRHLMGDR